MINTYMTPSISAKIKDLARAKQVISEWDEYRLQVERLILAELGEAGVTLPDSGTVTVGEELQIVCSTRRDWDQGCLALFAAKHPEQVGATLMHELKPISKDAVDSFLASAHPGAAELRDCFAERSIKPSFRLK